MRKGLLRRGAIAVAVSAVVLIPIGTAAMAANATGCAGSATSYAANGDVVDNVRAPGPGGTEAQPFVVDPEGSVAWEGGTTTVITNGTWSVSLFGAPFRSGSFTNDEGKRKASGVQEMSTLPSIVQFFLMGDMKVPVSGTVTGDGGSCTVDGYITGIGAATGSPMFWMGAGVLLLAALLLFWLIVGTTAAPAVGPPAVESISGTEVTT